MLIFLVKWIPFLSFDIKLGSFTPNALFYYGTGTQALKQKIGGKTNKDRLQWCQFQQHFLSSFCAYFFLCEPKF
jgi:hypothetical protein